MTEFHTVLVANRGEIAVRVIRTLREMGIRSVAVYSDADADARHVAAADIAVRLGPAAARESYLSIEKVIAAAKSTGAQAIHPGYGFLAENSEFSGACAENGIVFLGPSARSIEVMGDKISAKKAVSAFDVPVVPGIAEPGLTDAELIAAAADIGYPVLIKPSAGGGGKGMHLVESEAELATAIAQARREAASSFGDDTLFLERFVLRPRHIEVQILADSHGNIVHLGERECSLQRRHQKVIEEAPSPLLDEATRTRIGAAAVATARSVDYVGAGTVEFIVSADSPDEFFFMEMNTRLQVEHPVTEMVTGIDLVEWQLRIGQGEPLGLRQEHITMTGHAIEARIYAEDPARGFLPTGGTVLALTEPDGPGVRVDSSLRVGTVVGSDYDPMLAKVIAHGPRRAEALARLDRALGEMAVPGVQTNIEFVRFLLADERVVAGDLDTLLLDARAEDFEPLPAPDDILAAAGLLRQLRLRESRGASPWDSVSGWRIGANAAVRTRMQTPLRTETVAVWGDPAGVGSAGARVSVGDGATAPARAAVDGGGLHVSVDGLSRTLRIAEAGGGGAAELWLGDERGTWRITEAEEVKIHREGAVASADIRSPMPGSVIEVVVADGDRVEAGARVVVVEAMKMEHGLTAPVAGTVELSARQGEQVKVDQLLARIIPDDPAAGEDPETSTESEAQW